MENKCQWYEGCGYPSLRSIARAVKTLAIEAGPIGVRPRNCWVQMKDSIMYRSEEMPDHRHEEKRTYTAEIEGIGEAQAESADLLLDELRRKVSEAR